MKALRSRCNAYILLLTVCTSLMGCQGLEGRPSPDNNTQALVVGSSTMNFGTVVAGNSQLMWNSIYNPTRHRVVVSQVTVSGTGFRLVNTRTPFTVYSGQHVWIQILFTPHSAGTASGTIAVSSNAPNPTPAISLAADVIAAGELAANPSKLTFGSVRVGSSVAKSATLTNTGDTSVTISQISAGGNNFAVSGVALPVSLSPNQSLSFRTAFSPKSRGAISSNVVVTASISLLAPNSRHSGGALKPHDTSESTTVTIPVAGSGLTDGQLVAPAAVSFGSARVGSTQDQSVTVTNSGGSTVTISQASITGAGFHLSTASTPMTLPAGQSATFNCSFAPQSAGAASGSLAITSDATNPSLTVALSGTGMADGSLTAGAVSFGSVTVGSSQKATATITNSGGSSVTISSATVSGAGFSLSSMNLPVTLSAGQSAAAIIAFAPQSAGSASGSLTVASDAPTPTLTVALSGTAVSPGALSANPSTLSFGSVAAGSSQTLQATLTNSGGASLTVSGASLSSSDFNLNNLSLPLTLGAGKSTTFNVVYSPQSAGSDSANLTISSNGSNPSLTIAVSGTATAAGTLAASPSSIPFGSVQVGDNSSKQATLTNSGGASITVSQVNASGNGFSVSGISLPMTLSAGQTFTFNVQFAPQSAGSASGTIAMVSSASGTAPSISLSGTGTAVGQASVSPTSLSFGSVAVGSSKNLTVTLSATGSSVTINSASASTPEFQVSGTSLPATIQAGKSASFTVTFTPQSSGSASATLSFVTAGSSTPLVASLSGTATAAAQHSVDLSWNASSSSAVVGYNVYRGSKSGGPYTRLNSSVDDGTSYSDSSVQAGQTYFYVTTAVGSDGSESSHSNEVSASVPTP